MSHGLAAPVTSQTRAASLVYLWPAPEPSSKRDSYCIDTNGE